MMHVTCLAYDFGNTCDLPAWLIAAARDLHDSAISPNVTLSTGKGSTPPRSTSMLLLKMLPPARQAITFECASDEMPAQTLPIQTL